jgi:hypothetical protein
MMYASKKEQQDPETKRLGGGLEQGSEQKEKNKGPDHYDNIDRSHKLWSQGESTLSASASTMMLNFPRFCIYLRAVYTLQMSGLSTVDVGSSDLDSSIV